MCLFPDDSTLHRISRSHPYDPDCNCKNCMTVRIRAIQHSIELHKESLKARDEVQQLESTFKAS